MGCFLNVFFIFWKLDVLVFIHVFSVYFAFPSPSLLMPEVHSWDISIGLMTDYSTTKSIECLFKSLSSQQMGEFSCSFHLCTMNHSCMFVVHTSPYSHILIKLNNFFECYCCFSFQPGNARGTESIERHRHERLAILRSRHQIGRYLSRQTDFGRIVRMPAH